MKNILGSILLAAAALGAQTVETVPFRAVLSSRNEVPIVTDINASGAATVLLHLVRDAGGQVVSASVDFDVTYVFPGAVTITGLHIHSGGPTVSGPVTVSSGISGGAASVQDASGSGAIWRQAQVDGSATVALDTLKGMLDDPGGYYVNLHTSTHPAGVIRGQLRRAERLVLMALMKSSNEVPPIDGLDASGAGAVDIVATRDASGALTSAQAVFTASYSFPGAVTFTGFHIHAGAAGVSGPVTINTGLRNAPSAAIGEGDLRYVVEVPLSNADALSTLNGLFTNPANYYLNLHTTINAGGAIRGQLRTTDRMPFQAVLSPANQVPPVTDLAAQAGSETTLYTLRNPDGSVAAGLVTFDVNYRFPGPVEITSLHIHDQVAGQNGQISVPTEISADEPVVSDTGFGNIYRSTLVDGGAALAGLNSMVENPENHYVNLHSRAQPAGVVRAQLAPATTARPAIYDVISAVSDPGLSTLAPGGLMTVFGANLAKVADDLKGVSGDTVPAKLNGVQVTVDGLLAPIVLLAPDFVVAQVPVETAPGLREVAVKNSNGTSAARRVRVAAVAPAIYFDGVGGIAFHVTDMSLVRPDSPARPGELVAIYCTGLGQTLPPLATGRLASDSPLSLAGPVAVTIGGREAATSGAGAIPGLIGQYLVLAQVPPETTAGSAAVMLRMGEVASNAVPIAVR